MPTTAAKKATRTDPATWVDRHGDTLYRYALARVHRPDVAEDLVQETLLAGLKSRDSFEGRSSEQTWLIGILKHKLVDHFRARSREAPSAEPDRDETDTLFDAKGQWRSAPKAWTTPEQSLKAQEFWAAMTRCLSALPPHLGAAFTLREIEGLKSEEVCKILEISATNLWVRLHRARLRLRQCLEFHLFS